MSSYDSAPLSYIMFLKQKVGLNIKQIEKVHCTSLPPYSCWYIINSQFVKNFFSKDGSCSSIVFTLTFRQYHIKSWRKERKLAFITFFSHIFYVTCIGMLVRSVLPYCLKIPLLGWGKIIHEKMPFIPVFCILVILDTHVQISLKTKLHSYCH